MTEGQSMIGVRKIRKYPNRRLYDTTDSRYITFKEVHLCLLRGQPVIVICRKTGADITREVLLQVLASVEERRGIECLPPLLSTVRLVELLRSTV